MNLKNTMFVLVIVVFILQMLPSKEDTSLKDLNTSQKKVIALSTFPLYDIAKNIAKDKIITYMILPIGVDIHSYEPTPKDIVKLHLSSLVIYNGASLEPWISNLNFKNKNIDMSKYVDLIEITKKGHNKHEHHKESCSHEKIDPHYWLSISNMKKATIKITSQIIELDIENKDFYLENQRNYINKLEKLDLLYKDKLKTCKKKEILTKHNAFSYLANSYGFEVLSLSSISPDAQVDAKSMINLIKHVKEHNISTIFYESFASSRAIQAIANESKVKVKVLQPLANVTADEKKQNLSYEDIMKENLVKLQEAMECR